MSDNVPSLVIELGINHQGLASIAKQMIDDVINAAFSAGFPPDKLFFKLQKRNPEKAVPEHMRDVPRKDLLTGELITYIEYKRRIEFGASDLLHLAAHCNGTGGLFVSVWDQDSVQFVGDYLGNSPYIKIPSAHLTNDDLVTDAISTGIPIIMSTGMSTEEEIAHAVKLIPSHYGKDFVLLSTTSTYPCPDEEVNLTKMLRLKKMVSGNVGFSSHSVSPFPVIYAAVLGANMVEVHFTLDRSMPGSDHAASLELPAIKLIMRELLRIPNLLGDGECHVYKSELEKRKSLRGY